MLLCPLPPYNISSRWAPNNISLAAVSSRKMVLLYFYSTSSSSCVCYDALRFTFASSCLARTRLAAIQTAQEMITLKPMITRLCWSFPWSFPCSLSQFTVRKCSISASSLGSMAFLHIPYLFLCSPFVYLPFDHVPLSSVRSGLCILITALSARNCSSTSLHLEDLLSRERHQRRSLSFA